MKEFKKCRKCGATLSVDKFYPNRATCKECICKASSIWQKENPDKIKQYKQKWFQKTYPNQKEVYKERYRKKSPEKLKQYRKTSMEKMPELYALHRKLRLHRVKIQTPKWSDRKKIREFYILAKKLTLETGIIHTVDHILPLCGKTVSGLHVENNLQILTKSDNSKKGNKL